MADEPIIPAAAPAPAPAAAPAPVSPAAPAAAPAADAPAAAPAPTEAAPAAVDGAAPSDGGGLIEKVTGTEPAAKLPGDEPTLLEQVGREEPKPGDKPAEPKPGEKLAEAAPTVTFQPYHAPDGLKLDDTRVTELNDVITRDLPPQERRDTLLGMHVEEMKRYDAALREDQQNAFRDTRAQWRKELMADPELGGSGFETTKLTGAEMRDLFASRHKPGTEQYRQEMQEFNDMLRYTGVGDHPAFWRLLNNVGRRFKEPASPQHEFKPPPDLGRRPGAKGRQSALYDHPTSSQNRDNR